MVIDQETRLDNAVVIAENEFQYNYTLFNKRKEELDVQSLETLIRPTLLNQIRTNPDLQVFRNFGTTMSYH